MKTIILISLLAILCTTVHAQDPVKTSPQYYKVLLENDQVRVLEYRLKASEKEPMHSHPTGVVYVLSGVKLKFTYPDGRTEERAAATGETIWRELDHTRGGEYRRYRGPFHSYRPQNFWPAASLISDLRSPAFTKACIFHFESSLFKRG